MASFSLDPSILPSVPDRKGTIYLRSNHMRYGRATLNSNWHGTRLAEPKDYDIMTTSGKKDLLKATYTRIGNTDMPIPSTTATEAMSEAQTLKKDYEARDMRKKPVREGNFAHCLTQRHTGGPSWGHGSVLPRHPPGHTMRDLTTCHKVDYQYRQHWNPMRNEEDEEEEVSYHHCLSEFTDTTDHRRKGMNTWQDCSGSVRTYTIPTDT